MRDRWRTISALWEENKAGANRLNLLGQLNYYGKLSDQMVWWHDHGGRPVRVVYGASGAPTAALLHEEDAIVDYTLFWIACKDVQEANYLLAIVNSDALRELLEPLMPKGQFGARHVQKHLWRLRIPAFDSGNSLHVTVSWAGEVAVGGAAQQLERLSLEHPNIGVTIARRELRKWLRGSKEGRAVEEAVGILLADG